MIKYVSLASGSNGNSHFLMGEKTNLLVDVGKSAKYIESALRQLDAKMQEVHAILISHEHVDHVSGLKVLAKRYSLPIYIHSKSYEKLRVSCDLEDKNIKFLDELGNFEIGEFQISTFDLPHDSAACVGFQIAKGKKQVAIATDVGEITDSISHALENANLLVLEANHDEALVHMGPYPYHLKKRILGRGGHLSNENCGKAIRKAFEKKGKLQQVLLSHLSESNNDPYLALATVVSVLKEKDIRVDVDFSVEVSPRNGLSPVYYL